MRAQTLPRSFLAWFPDAKRTSKPIRLFVSMATIARIAAVDADMGTVARGPPDRIAGTRMIESMRRTSAHGHRQEPDISSLAGCF